MASGVFKSSTTSNGKYMSIEWRSTANASTRTSTFTAKMVFHGSIQGNALDCNFEDLDIDYDNKISVQYWSYYNSLALIQSQLGVDSDECQLTMYLNPNE